MKNTIVSIFCTILFACLSTNLFAQQALRQQALRVENVMRIKGQEPTMIRGIGIVTGLNGTGDNPRDFGPTARAQMRMLELSGHPRSNETDRSNRPVSVERQLGSSRNNAMVEVTVTIPGTGARSGDTLTCTVSSIGNAKSLENGVLSVCVLAGSLPQAPEATEILGQAWGKLSIERQSAPLVGTIKNGCRLTADFINPYIEDGNMTLVVRPEYAGPRLPFYVAEAINRYGRDTGQGNDIAMAMNQNYVVVKVPTEYFADPMRFVAELMEIPIVIEKPLTPRVLINERAGIILIGEDVEVKPVVINHKNILAEVRPPVAPPEQELNPQKFVDVDTDTKYRQFMGEAVQNQKLKALQASLDAVRVETADMIEIIKKLNDMGAIVGEVVISE